MKQRRLLGALALAATLTAGAGVGAILGVPGVSSAQSDESATTGDDAGTPASTERCHGGHRAGGGRHLDAAADALGMTASELLDELRAGRSIADVAREHGIAVDEVVEALVAAAEERIDQAVADGRLTDEQAAERKATITERVTAWVEGDRPAGHGFGPGHGRHAGLRTAPGGPGGDSS